MKHLSFVELQLMIEFLDDDKKIKRKPKPKPIVQDERQTEYPTHRKLKNTPIICDDLRNATHAHARKYFYTELPTD